MKDLKALIKEIESADLIAFDLETTSLQPMEADIVGISFSVQADSGYYIPIKYPGKGKNDFGDYDLTTVLSTLKPMLENVTLPKTGQNIKYDVLILKRNGIDVKGIEFDTMIAAHLLKPEERSYKLDYLSLEYIKYEMQSITDLIGSGRNQISMSEVPVEKVTYYAAEDAEVTWRLWHKLSGRLPAEEVPLDAPRSATIIGAITGGGIGLLLTQAIATQKDWEEVTYYIVLIVLMVMAMDSFSGWLRRKLINGDEGGH